MKSSRQAYRRAIRKTTRFRYRDFFCFCLLLAAGLGIAGTVRAKEPFDAFLEQHCIRCHGPEKEKGDLRIDQLSRDFKLGVDAQRWAEVIEQVDSGEMPPKKEKKPTQDEIAAFVTNLDSLIKEGRAARMAARPAGGALPAEPERVSKHGL
jgi:mono/diheme cytochrome c family protein